MFAQVIDGAITQTASSVQKMFSYAVPEGAGFSSMSDFMRDKGVLDVVNGERKHDHYYYVTQGDITLVDGVPTQSYTNTAKALEDADATDRDGNNVLDSDGNQVINYGLKTTMTDQVKTTANSLLAKTDWMVIRKAERDVDIPSATATYRAAVLTECARLESAITGAANVDALQVVMAGQDWPQEP